MVSGQRVAVREKTARCGKMTVEGGAAASDSRENGGIRTEFSSDGEDDEIRRDDSWKRGGGF